MIVGSSSPSSVRAILTGLEMRYFVIGQNRLYGCSPEIMAAIWINSSIGSLPRVALFMMDNCPSNIDDAPLYTFCFYGVIINQADADSNKKQGVTVLEYRRIRIFLIQNLKFNNLP